MQDRIISNNNTLLKLGETRLVKSCMSHLSDQVTLQGDKIQQGSTRNANALEDTIKGKNAEDQETGSDIFDSKRDTAIEEHLIENKSEVSEDDSRRDTPIEAYTSENRRNMSENNREQDTIMEGYSSDHGSEDKVTDETDEELEDMPLSNAFLDEFLP